ncbi:hypothetical protein EYF80_015946 [Liparis tanakae]|uniref:Uncharacterized protein n=1 Tax=Liparis tanakae TaxID=230148 RepID=A0A4Z2I797_9TELE|nr:hypothetical protein EYF80_015946 [Liparis tanakae]
MRLRVGTSRPGGDQGGDVAHGLVDAVAVLQRGGVTVQLLGQTVKIRKPPQQVLPTGLPQLRVAHQALHQVQPAQHRIQSRTPLALPPRATPPPLAAAVLTEAPPPGAVGQRQQQEEDAAHDEDGAGAADARHRPGQLVVEGNRVVAGQEGQDGLVEHHQSDEHQST